MIASEAGRRRAAEQAWGALRPRLADDAVAALGPDEADAFLTRIGVALVDIHEPLAALYGDRADADALLERAVRAALAAAVERPEELRRLDRRREIDPTWFQGTRMQGYVCSVDRFCGTLAELPGRLDYLGDRRAVPPLRGDGECAVLDVGNDAVLGWRRRHPRSGTFIGLANFSPATEAVVADTVTGFGTFEPVLASDGRPDLRADRLLVPGLGFAWFAEP